MVFQTDRLLLRELRQTDLNDLAEILQDQEVVYAYEHDFSDKDVQQWLDRQLARYQTNSFGLWAVMLKETGEMIGQAGLTFQPCEGESVLEIGYLLKRMHWHHGYATEAAEGCKQYAFSKLDAPKVHAVIKADNLPSIRVARRIGMKKEKAFTARYYNGEMLHYLFSISKNAVAK